VRSQSRSRREARDFSGFSHSIWSFSGSAITPTGSIVAQKALEIITSTYDASGNLSGSSDQNASNTIVSSYAYTYDKLDRMLTEDNNGTLGAARVIMTSTYDKASNRLTLASTINAAADFTRTYTYDAIN